jgi:copper(I)-binding protein
MYRQIMFFIFCFMPAFVLAGHHESKGHGSDMHIMDAWIKEPLSGMDATAAYLLIHNHSEDSDRLMGVVTDIAEVAEIHEMTLVDGVMKMRRVDAGVSIAPDERASLEPGGLHIMLFNVNREIHAGEAYVISLNFKRSGQVDIPFIVKKGVKPKSEQHDHHHDHDH